MEAIYETMGIDWKAAGRRVRQMSRVTAATLRSEKPNDAGIERPLYLSQKEAMHLLVLCAASPAAVDNGEETLFAKVHEHLRRF